MCEDVEPCTSLLRHADRWAVAVGWTPNGKESRNARTTTSKVDLEEAIAVAPLDAKVSLSVSGGRRRATRVCWCGGWLMHVASHAAVVTRGSRVAEWRSRDGE